MEVRVPDLGNFKDVAVIDVLVKPGDTIAVDTPLVTLESDKATMDVPSTVSGVVEKVHAAKGGKLNAGDLIVTVQGDGAGGRRRSARAPRAGNQQGSRCGPRRRARGSTAAAAGPSGAGPGRSRRWRPLRQDGAALPARRADLVPRRPGAHR